MANWDFCNQCNSNEHCCSHDKDTCINCEYKVITYTQQLELRIKELEKEVKDLKFNKKFNQAIHE